MLQRGLEPTIRIYTTLIRGCFGRHMVIEAMKYYDLAIKSHDTQRLNLRWKEDMDELTSTVISGYLTSNHYDQAQSFMNSISQAGNWHRTTTKPFVYFIRWLAQHERVDEAWNVFNFHATLSTGFDLYRLRLAVLRAIYLDRGDVFGGLRYFRQMEKSCAIYEQNVYADLVSAFMINGERATAESIWLEALEFLRMRQISMQKQLQNEGKRWGLFARESRATEDSSDGNA